jgi:release factor glutamine methyltransferase
LTYVSREDSELLRKALQNYSGNSCLEIGFGYGSNLLSVKGRFTDIVGTEIERTDGFHRVESNDVTVLLADGASCFRPKSFDLIFINPPYLPTEENADRATDGGAGGFEIARQLLTQSLSVLSSKGRILIVLSSETSKTEFDLFCQQENLMAILVLSKRLFLETLFVYELSKE